MKWIFFLFVFLLIANEKAASLTILAFVVVTEHTTEAENKSMKE